MSKYTDEQLVDLFVNGNRKDYAFNQIVLQYSERLYWHIRKIVIIHDDADDVLQNTFIKAFKGLNNFRGDSKLFTWLYKIATNESLYHLKQKKNKYNVPLGDVEYQLANSLEADVFFDGDEIQRKLQRAILTLPEKQRLVFNMKYFDELKFREISEILGTSEGALKASYHLAVKKIEENLKID